MSLPEKKPMSVIAEEERKRAEEEKELVKSPETTSCSCADRDTTDQSMREKEVSSSIAFENALHNQVYVKRMNARRRRDVTAELPKEANSDQQVRSTKTSPPNIFTSKRLSLKFIVII